MGSLYLKTDNLLEFRGSLYEGIYLPVAVTLDRGI